MVASTSKPTIPALRLSTAWPEGGLWCLPWNHATEGLYYNKTLLAEAGVEEPDENWTWDDLPRGCAYADQGCQ